MVGPVVGHEVEALLVVTGGLHLAGEEGHGDGGFAGVAVVDVQHAVADLAHALLPHPSNFA